LIRTQRKLKREYEEIRKSQTQQNFNQNPFSKKKIEIKAETAEKRLLNSIEDSPRLKKKNSKMSKVASQSTNKKIYVKQTNINLMEVAPVEQMRSSKREAMTENGSMKFPMGQFLSASSDFEENMVIERFSMQLHSQSQGSILNHNTCTKVQKKSKNNAKKAKPVNDLYFTKKGQHEDLKLVTDSHVVQNTLNSLQSLNSLKPLMNDSIATHNLKNFHHEPKPSEYSQIERISSVQKKSVVNTNESERCPFKSNNRSPDSFIRISANGKDELHPNITRVSLLSMVQNSETKTSHIS
jgi:hypothetical protein